MDGPQHEGLPPDVRRVLEDARILRERLRRLLSALTLSAELVADHFERLAETASERREDLVLRGKGARESASLYRDFLARLDREG